MQILILPILLPVVFIVPLILSKSVRLSRGLGITSSILLLVIALILFVSVLKHGILTLFLGGWEAPYGITLVADTTSALMVLVSAFIAFTISVYSLFMVSDDLVRSKFYVFFNSLILGVNGAFLTGDVFNLYVWFEVMLLSSFVLITLGNNKAQLEGGIKYMAMNLIGSLLFLIGLGLLYGKTGTLNMAHLATILNEDNNNILMNTSSVLFFVAFGIKAAVFPLFFWLPASYHTANISVTSLFAGLLTKVGVYVLFRFFTLFFIQDQDFWHQLLLIIAAATMLFGGMAASVYYDSRRILSYHIISQIGYMIMGLGIYTPLAIAGAIYFTIHNMIAKTNTFVIAGLIAKKNGTFDLKESGGLLKASPILAILFIIPALALAGVPPVSGFFAKFFLIKGGYEAGDYIITSIAVFTGLLTLYSMVKIWFEAFLKPVGNKNKNSSGFSFIQLFPSILLGTASIALGIFASYGYDIAIRAANELFSPEAYIHAVLNK